MWCYRRLALHYDSCWVHSSAAGNETLMHITDANDGTGSFARSGWRWSGLPGRSGSRARIDGQMFVLVPMEKKKQKHSVYMIRDREWAEPTLRGNSKHCIPKGHHEEKKAAVHKWIKQEWGYYREQWSCWLGSGAVKETKWIHSNESSLYMSIDCSKNSNRSHFIVRPVRQATLLRLSSKCLRFRVGRSVKDAALW